jgi:hypothetical protein
MGFLDDMKDKASGIVDDVKDKLDRDDDDASSDSGADGGADAGADVPGMNDTDADVAPTTADTLGGGTMPAASTYDTTSGTGDYADSTSTAVGGSYDDSLGTTGSSLDDTAGSTYDETTGPIGTTYDDDTVGVAGGTSAAGADDPSDALGDVTTASPGGLGDTDQDRSNL